MRKGILLGITLAALTSAGSLVARAQTIPQTAAEIEQRAGRVPASPLITPKAAFTDAARASGFKGAVKVSFVITTTGLVTDAKILMPVGYGLDETVLSAVQQYKFKPATENGVPIPVTVQSADIVFDGVNDGYIDVTTVRRVPTEAERAALMTVPDAPLYLNPGQPHPNEAGFVSMLVAEVSQSNTECHTEFTDGHSTYWTTTPDCQYHKGELVWAREASNAGRAMTGSLLGAALCGDCAASNYDDYAHRAIEVFIAWKVDKRGNVKADRQKRLEAQVSRYFLWNSSE